MHTILHKTALFALILSAFSCNNGATPKEKKRIELAGNWSVVLDTSNQTIREIEFYPTSTDSMQLPGTTDLAKIGTYNVDRSETNALSREYQFEGQAVYSRRVVIPESWAGSVVRLTAERSKPSRIFVDNQYVGENDNISTPQYYDLSYFLTPGEHQITLIVDNRPSAVPSKVFHSSHAYSASTQTNWNGVIGEFFLESVPLTGIKELQVAPNLERGSAYVAVHFRNESDTIKNGTLILEAKSTNGKKIHTAPKQTYQIDLTDNIQSFDYPLGAEAATWSEFDPTFYNLTATWINPDGTSETKTTTFGFRSFRTAGKQFLINDKKTYLRGKHDACVFPLTGHTAMDTETWRSYFQTAKAYGINHYRFHSWCPPKACFEAADLEGIYLQPELPIWGSIDKSDTLLCQYLLKEGRNLHREYSNHASFVMFGLGNEMWGDEMLTMLVDSLRRFDRRHLFAAGSNNALGFNGPLPVEDYLTTCRIGQQDPNSFETHTRASFSFADAYDGGYLNHVYPNTTMDFSKANQLCSIPVIGHETGQFQIYPNFPEMEKYTGALKPYNIAVFKQRLADAGMLDQADDFLKASGKWSALLYRADIEMNLRTPDWGGFQLLDLQDYPGQGSAYVGVLDAFMDSKGLITPEEWQQFCGEIVPLLKLEKFCWTATEPISGEVAVFNYSANELKNQSLNWQLLDDQQQVKDEGVLPIEVAQGCVKTLGTITPKFEKSNQPEKLTLELSIAGTNSQNSYPIWIYPENQSPEHDANMLITQELNAQTLQALQQGEKVLLFPKQAAVAKQTVPGLFQTDYWNYRMFKTICENIKKPISPGTLGLLMDPTHPVFNEFPTEFHTNWQWFPIVKQSYPMILDPLPSQYRPIVQVIDNIERNHKLGLLYELQVENGKLLVCMADLEPVMDKPEVRQWKKALIQYMNSAAFNPTQKLSADELKQLFTQKAQQGEIKQLGNISYD